MIYVVGVAVRLLYEKVALPILREALIYGIYQWYKKAKEKRKS